MNLREQEYVLAIAKYQTLKSAAEFLNISSPTLSVFLSTLEQNLGVPLFHRFGKKFVPTEVVAVLSPLHPLAAQMAAEGLGIAFHFLGYIQYFSYPKPISCFPVGDPKVLIDYYIVRRKDAYLAPQISDFIQILGKQMVRHAPLVLPQGERGV